MRARARGERATSADGAASRRRFGRLPAAGRLAVLAGLTGPGAAAAQDLPVVDFRPGMEITRSVRIAPGTYRAPGSPGLDAPILTVRGEGIVVDLTGVVLEGIDPAADPDIARGVAILVDGGRDIRIRGGTIRGYHIGILAEETRGFHLSGGDLSYNWKPRLYSLVEHESLLDWLSFHDNENRQWLRFGAAIYLDGVTGGTIERTTVVQGMNALLMNRTDSMTIRDNDFSFNSGLGIGMYRSSDNRIFRNRIDFDVRGYSHGFYHRGQDSAGILIYEQSMRNVIAYNSATHGGDGVFIWAGQTTMETGEGGVNDNLFYGNDFSFAPANAIETTFSRNTFIANRAEGSDYGVWGGYSRESVFAGNCFLRNRIGIAIEHGQENRISGNLFHGDSTAVSLWANPSEPEDWGYPRHRDTRSRDTRIEGNVFSGHRVGIRGTRTRDVEVVDNRWSDIDSLRVLADTAGFEWRADNAVGEAAGTPGCDAVPPLDAELASLAPAPEGGTSVPTTPLARRDRSAMIVDEWGPYDWRSPKLWPTDSVRASPLRLQVMGPPGEWRVVEREGIAVLSKEAGRTTDTVAVTPEPGRAGDWTLELEYRGAATVSPRGERRAAGQPVRFAYSRFEPAVGWDTRFFSWTADPAPDGTVPLPGPEAIAAAPTIGADTLPRLDLQWYRPLIEGLPIEYWGLEATGRVTLGPGEHTLRTISDDGIRVRVDGELVIDNWAPHGSEVDFASIEPGTHDLRVEYAQAGGWTELRVEIVRGRLRSPGSPGPH